MFFFKYLVETRDLVEPRLVKLIEGRSRVGVNHVDAPKFARNVIRTLFVWVSSRNCNVDQRMPGAPDRCQVLKLAMWMWNCLLQGPVGSTVNPQLTMLKFWKQFRFEFQHLYWRKPVYNDHPWGPWLVVARNSIMNKNVIWDLKMVVSCGPKVTIWCQFR